jgi:hypothetical protein
MTVFSPRDIFREALDFFVFQNGSDSPGKETDVGRHL